MTLRLEWLDYPAMGFESEHSAELIRMATDPDLNAAPSDGNEVWAPLHAWRPWACSGTSRRRPPDHDPGRPG